MWSEVEGSGILADCQLFGGHYSGRSGWSAFLRSGSDAQSLFSPSPHAPERVAVGSSESAVIEASGASLPGRGHWFFTPAPFCYGLSPERPPPASSSLPDGPWLMLGLAAAPRAHSFTAFAYDALEDGFSLRLPYEGHTRVNGSFRTPAVVFVFGCADPHLGIARHTAILRERGLLPPPAERPRPAWWSRPIFCGWGAQCHLAGPGRASDLSRQDRYDGFLAALESHGVYPGTVIIDDKWQRSYALSDVDEAKWPDLPGWIARRHATGQRVLLWWKAWDPEGLPADQCVRNAAGMPVTADPTDPGYERTLRQSVRRMLSPDGYGADGLKIDFTALTPSGSSLVSNGDAWGIELLHRLLAIVRDEAKRAKPDALILGHAAAPYFAPLLDMVRLNDMLRLYDARPGAPVVEHMRHRAATARAACPELLVDTDNWAAPDRATWRAYVLAQPELGVPCLYYATHIDRSGEALEAEDYAAIRFAWARHEAGGAGAAALGR
ncbi:MAG: hypothetical protein ABR525_07010 [Candidatus Limnocylindria bacterium]